MIIEGTTPSRRYFTIRELLVVVALVALGFAVLVPMIRSSREADRRQRCMNNLRRFSVGVHNHHDIRQEICPSYLTDDHSPAALPKGFVAWPLLLFTWTYDLDDYYQLVTLNVPLDEYAPSPADHATLRALTFAFHLCPSRRSVDVVDQDAIARGDYACVSLAALNETVRLDQPRTWDGSIVVSRVFNAQTVANPVQLNEFPAGTLHSLEYRSMTAFLSVTDGLSNTAFIGEKAVHQDRLAGPQTDLAKAALPGEQDGTFYFGRGGDPANLKAPGAMAFWSRRLAPAEPGERLLPKKPRLEDPNNRFGGWHPGVTLFLLGDGSVRAVNNDAATIALQRLGCRNDGEKLELP